MTPTLTILIPTPGLGRPLGRCLQSVREQPLLPGDEVLVIGDTAEGPLPEVESTVASFDPTAEVRRLALRLADHIGPLPLEVVERVECYRSPYRYLEHAGQVHTFIGDTDYHSFGHEQLNHGIGQARGDLLVFQDDDDIFTEGALAAIREAAAEHPGRPLLFRFVSRFRTLVWGAAKVIAQDHIGGHCFVVPNRPEYLGEWGPHYQGDYTFIRETLDRWPGLNGSPPGDDAVVWVDKVIALARPDQ